MPPNPAILLIAHGSRNQKANDDLYWLAGELKRRGFEMVEPSFLEIATPDIHTAGKTCVEKGATNVLMVPYFLAAGIHVQEDLTKAKGLLSQEYPNVTFQLAQPLGRHPSMVDLVMERITETAEKG